jgi:K+ transport systems, NAD-binding component
MSKNEKRSVLVIGVSKLGAEIANYESLNGVDIAIVDINEGAFRKLDERFSGYKIIGNALDFSTLKKAHIEEASDVCIVTNDDATNIFLTYLVTHYYPNKKIILRLNDEKKIKILPKNQNISSICPSIYSFKEYLTESKK